MHGTAPLLRSVTSAASQTPSKIPHLRFHIAVRQARRQQPGQNARETSLWQRRCHSTFISQEYIDRAISSSEAKSRLSQSSVDTTELEISNSNDAVSTESIFVQKPKHTNMFDVLEEGLRDRILSGLMSDSIGSPFIRQADDALFKKALLSLDPEYFIGPFKESSRHYKGPRTNAILKTVLKTRSLDDILTSFALYLDRIVGLRRESGWKLDLETCNHLLRCAGSMGDPHLATSIMGKVMPADGVVPDMESYNYYCQALIWSRAFSSSENYNMRVIPRHLEIRSSRSPPANLSGHTTSHSKLGGGIREEVLNTFKESMSKGHTGSELTFLNLMIAMGREADLDGVKSILKSVWNIDVNLLSAFDEEEIESPTFYEERHPLRPSEDLLYSVAHIFGSNNDIRTAWLLVDFISRNYDLRITERVWLQLCEWAFLLSLRRSGSDRRQGRGTGQIPQEMFVKLFEAMTDEPHNIKPNAVMHFLLARSWRDRKHLDKTVWHVVKLGEIVEAKQKLVNQLADEVVSYSQSAIDSKGPDAFVSEEFYGLRRRYTIAYHEFQQGLQLMNVAVSRNLLMERDWAGSGRLNDWERRRLPDIVGMFTGYLPPNLVYPTKTGTIRLTTKHKRLAHTYNSQKTDYRVLPRILNAMDTEDQARLERRMRALPKMILRTSKYCFNCESSGHTHSNCPNKSFASSTFDYKGEKADSSMFSDNSDMLVVDPTLPKELFPFEFEPGSEKDHSNPELPFR